MKAFEHGGKKYTNADAWRSAKSMSSGKAPMGAGGSGAEQAMVEPEDETDPHSVREAHGPAHTVQVSHDHEMGVHEVHSDHPDGHHHHSAHHEDAAAAHEHAKNLAVDDATMGLPKGEETDGYGENE